MTCAPQAMLRLMELSRLGLRGVLLDADSREPLCGRVAVAAPFPVAAMWVEAARGGAFFLPMAPGTVYVLHVQPFAASNANHDVRNASRAGSARSGCGDRRGPASDLPTVRGPRASRGSSGAAPGAYAALRLEVQLPASVTREAVLRGEGVQGLGLQRVLLVRRLGAALAGGAGAHVGAAPGPLANGTTRKRRRS
jgi:hypothetical protein